MGRRTAGIAPSMFASSFDAVEPDGRDDRFAVGFELLDLDPLKADLVSEAVVEAPCLVMPPPDLALVEMPVLVGAHQLDLRVEVLEHAVDVAVVERGVVGADHTSCAVRRARSRVGLVVSPIGAMGADRGDQPVGDREEVDRPDRAGLPGLSERASKRAPGRGSGRRRPAGLRSRPSSLSTAAMMPSKNDRAPRGPRSAARHLAVLVVDLIATSSSSPRSRRRGRRWRTPRSEGAPPSGFLGRVPLGRLGPVHPHASHTSKGLHFVTTSRTAAPSTRPSLQVGERVVRCLERVRARRGLDRDLAGERQELAPSRRVRFATERIWRSCQRSSYGIERDVAHVDAGADDGAAAAEGTERGDDHLAGRREDDRGVELLRKLVRRTGPLGAEPRARKRAFRRLRA